MAREFDRERGREICERLNVRPELREHVSFMYSFLLYHPELQAFIEECFAEDDRKGLIAIEMTKYCSLYQGGSAALSLKAYKDAVDALYQIKDKYIFWYLTIVNGFLSMDDRRNYDPRDYQFMFAFIPTLTNDNVQRRFGHSLEDLTIDEFKQLLRDTPGYRDNDRLLGRIFRPENDRQALQTFRHAGVEFHVESRPKVLERRRGLLHLIDMGQRRGELEDQEYQEQLRRESEMREATAVEQYAQRLIDVIARVRLGIKRGGKAREQDVKRPREE